MEEGKYKRRLMTLSPVDIAGWEEWLSAMAEKGLFIVKFGMWFAHFRVGEPKKTAYRLEPCEYGEDAPKPQQQEMYQEFGWEFVGILRESFFVFANEEESPVEIHTDPVAQSFTLQKMLRSKKRELLLENFLVFAILLYFGYLFYTPSALWKKNLILQNDIRFPLILLFLGVSYALVVGEYRHIKKIVTALDRGIPFSHQAERRKNGRRKIGLSVCYLFILFWILLYAPLSWMADLPEERETATYPAVIRNAHGEEIPVSMGKDTSLLAPKQYTILWEGEGETLILEWVETRSIRLAQRLADSYPLREEQLSILQTEQFDHAVRSDNPAATKLFLQKDNRFLYVYYLGEQDIGVYLPDLAKFMETEPKNSL